MNANFVHSVPAGAATVIILMIAIPPDFPYQGMPNYVAPTWRQRLSRSSLARLDGSGAFLLLGATLLFVTVLLEAGTQFAWKSAASITCLVISGILWILFALNERILSKEQYKQEPIFPWRFLLNRPWMAVLM